MPARDDRGAIHRDLARGGLGAAGWAAGGAVRLLACAILLLVPVALLLGRQGRPDVRWPVAAATVPLRIGALAFGPSPGPDLFLDVETGRPVSPALPAGGQLRGSAWAPWRDEGGRALLVGLWSGWTGEGSLEQSLSFVSQPDGALLESLSLAELPNLSGSPCWSPDRPGRLLLAGGDGRLYRVDLGGPGGTTLAPRPLAWPGGEGWPRVAKLSDLAWPGGHVLGGRTVLAASCSVSRNSEPHPDEWSIHWIRLDPGCAEVVASGTLVGRGSAESPGEDARYPALGSGVEGVSRLAWLERGRGRIGEPWRLRVASIDVDPSSCALSLRPGPARTLAEDCAATAPAFSADGRWISYVPAPAGTDPPRLRRLSLADGGDGPRAVVVALAPGPDGR